VSRIRPRADRFAATGRTCCGSSQIRRQLALAAAGGGEAASRDRKRGSSSSRSDPLLWTATARLELSPLAGGDDYPVGEGYMGIGAVSGVECISSATPHRGRGRDHALRRQEDQRALEISRRTGSRTSSSSSRRRGSARRSRTRGGSCGGRAAIRRDGGLFHDITACRAKIHDVRRIRELQAGGGLPAGDVRLQRVHPEEVQVSWAPPSQDGHGQDSDARSSAGARDARDRSPGSRTTWQRRGRALRLAARRRGAPTAKARRAPSCRPTPR